MRAESFETLKLSADSCFWVKHDVIIERVCGPEHALAVIDL